MRKAEMLCIDLETTGLLALSEVPLELGLTITDKWGAVIGEWKTLIWEENNEFSNALDNMIPYVRNMHNENGLLNDMNNFAKRTRYQTEVDAITWLKSHGVEKFTLPMSGSSIGSLDRPFSIIHFPLLHEFFHYRNIDVSTVRELCKMHNPLLWEKMEASMSEMVQEKHRVLEDIQDSLILYRSLYENFLFLED
jgi:oligoribonuclease